MLFILAVPLLVPVLLWMLFGVKRWGRIPVSILIFDGIVVLAISYSLKTHWGTTPPPFISALFPAVIVGCVATSILWFRRLSSGHANKGMLLGYSGLVVQGLIWGTIFSFAAASVLINADNPGTKWYGLLILGLGLLVTAMRSVINES